VLFLLVGLTLVILGILVYYAWKHDQAFIRELSVPVHTSTVEQRQIIQERLDFIEANPDKVNKATKDAGLKWP
jgi:hypothetical protein